MSEPEDDGVSTPANKGGRPPKLDASDPRVIEYVKGLALLQCTLPEMAAALFVSHKTFKKFRDDHPEVAEAIGAGKGGGLVSLRRVQFRLAQKSAAMAIFLGKNYLGQTDRQQHEHTGANGGPIQNVDLTGASAEDLDRLENLLGISLGSGESGEDQAED